MISLNKQVAILEVRHQACMKLTMLMVRLWGTLSLSLTFNKGDSSTWDFGPSFRSDMIIATVRQGQTYDADLNW